jgi:hypothetical protein
MKKIKLTPADPYTEKYYTEKWTDLDFAKQYEPDAWERTKWEKLWETEEYKEDEEYEYVNAAEHRFLREWQDITEAAKTNVALKDLLDQAKMVYKLTKIK